MLSLCLLFTTIQDPTSPAVRRVFVTTPYNASIIFEYANAAIPEGQPLTPEAVDCLSSQLTATGLFSNVQVITRPVEQGKVDVDILPTWSDLKESLLIKEIVLEGFTNLDQRLLAEKLGQRGLKVGTPLLRYPLPAIRQMLLGSIREVYESDSKKMYDAEEKLSDVSLWEGL